jgi:hypothetical protein
MGPIRRTIGLFGALAMIGVCTYTLVYLLFFARRFPLVLLPMAAVGAFIGLYWLWADYINADPKPEDKLAAAQSASSSRSWYEVLNVDAGANFSEIKAAYRKKIALYHPDRVAGLGSELRQLAETHAKEINAGYALACKLRGHRGD